MNKQNRYPGIRPFSSEDNRLFFGRSESIKRINRLFKLEKLIVLFGKSGLGKTSLVQAGAIPILQKEDLADGVEDFRFELLRFGAYHSGDSSQKGLTSETPVERIRRAIVGDHQMSSSDLFKIVKDDQSPWMAAKALQMDGDARTIVLILDQSEELFTWPQEEIDQVKDALQSLLNQNIPDAIRRTLHRAARGGELDYNLLMAPPASKAMLVIRSDKLDSLDQLADVLPDIYNKRYELPPLDRLAATEAILEPAQLSGEFSTPTFSYSDDCLNYILDFLSNTSEKKNETRGGKYQERIEGFQLQLICQHAEFKVKEKVAAGQTNIVLRKEDIGDLQEVTRSYYQRVLNGIPGDDEREKVQVLVEEGLIYEAGPDSRRLSLFDGLIESQYDVGPEKLDYLGNSRLLRRVSLPEGGFSYEISHDSLLAPILAVKEVRKGVEQQAAEAEEARLALIKQQEREAAEAKERQRKRTARYLVIVSLLTIFALGGMGFAFWQSGRVEKEKQEAIKQTHIADSLKLLAYELSELAENDAVRAKFSERNALLAKGKADSLMTVAVKDAKRMASLARELDIAKSESDRLNRKVLANSLLGRFRWMRKLDPFELDSYSIRKFGEWKSYGAGLNENFRLSETTVANINEAEFAFQGSNLDLETRLHVIHQLLQKNRDELSEAVASSTLKRGSLSSETQDYPEQFKDSVTAAAVFRKGNQIAYAFGNKRGVVEIRDQSFALVIDSLAAVHTKDEQYSDGERTVKCISFSADGKFLATGGAGGWVHVYHRTDNYSLIQKIYYGNDWVRDIAFSPSGDRLFVTGDLYLLKEYSISSKQIERGKSNETSSAKKMKVTYEVAVIDSLYGFDQYIYKVDVANSGDMFGTGGMSGETKIWKRNEGGWELIAGDYLPNNANVADVFWNNETMVVIDNTGIMWKWDTRSATEWVSDYNFGSDDDNSSPLLGDFSPNDQNWIVYDGTDGMSIIDKESKDVAELSTFKKDLIAIYPDEMAEEVTLVTAWSIHKLTYSRQPLDLGLEDLSEGINLPVLRPIQKIKIGMLGQADLDNMQTAEKKEVLDSIRSDFGSLDSRFEANYAALTISYLEEFLNPNSQSGLQTEFLIDVLNRLDQEKNKTQKFETTALFIASLKNGNLSEISRWLYWAYQWRITSPENLQLKRDFASLSYQAFPVDAWENRLMEIEASESVSSLVSFDVGSDVNSLAFDPHQNELLFTTDVGFQYPATTFLKINLEEETIGSPSRMESGYGGGYVWGAEYSESGAYSASYGDDGSELIVLDTKKKRILPGFPFGSPDFSKVFTFLSDRTILMVNYSGRGLSLIHFPEKENHPSVIPFLTFDDNPSLAAYWGEITDVERLTNTKFVASLNSGNLLFIDLLKGASNFSSINSEEIWDSLEEFEVTDQDYSEMKLAYVPLSNKLMVSIGPTIRAYSLPDDLILYEPAEMDSLRVIETGIINTLKSSSNSSSVVWRAGNEMSVVTFPFDYGLVIKRVVGTYSLFDVAISKDGRFIASGSEDDLIRVYRSQDFVQTSLEWLDESKSLLNLYDRGEAIKEDLELDFSEEFANKFWSSISQ